MQPAEIVIIETRKVRCDGGKGALGHPAVYLNMGHEDHVDCPYCGKQFHLSEQAKAHPADDHH